MAFVNSSLRPSPQRMAGATFVFFFMLRPAAAADTSKNPDRWTMMGFQAGGSTDIGDSQDVLNKGKTTTRGTYSHSGNFMNEFLVPLTNEWSVQGTAGLTSTQSSDNAAGSLAPSSGDLATVDASLQARYYFVDQRLTSADVSQNPDEWPSTGLTIGGSTELFDNSENPNATVPLPQEKAITQSLTFTQDARLPLTDHVTLNLAVGGAMSHSEMDGSATSTGTVTNTNNINATVDMRYYFVGHNAIHNDKNLNPDRWTSFGCSVEVLKRIDGTTEHDFVNGTSDVQDTFNNSVTFSSEWRIPVANSVSLRIGLGAGGSHAEASETKADAGTESRGGSLSGYLTVRYYFTGS